VPMNEEQQAAIGYNRSTVVLTGPGSGNTHTLVEKVCHLLEHHVGTDGGVRCVHVFFDLEDASDIPAFTEPFMQNANASIELLPVMNMEEQQAGMAKLH
jgi:hypothetical protein